MYCPPAFRVDDQETMFDFIDQYGFGLLTSVADGRPVVSHLPLVLDRNRNCLLGHFARANEHWKSVAGPVLCVFSGPHAYVSAAYYQDENVVPTWNYTAVHVSGTLRILDQPTEIATALEQGITHFERSRAKPWRIDLEGDFAQGLLRSVTAFEIAIETIEGKWKLSQNQTIERRERVIAAFSESGRESDRQLAELMKRHLAK